MIDRITPQPGQESVWDYPRPPHLEACPRPIEVIFNRVSIAKTQAAFRVLETSHPPVYYIPPEDIQMQYFTPTSRSSFCEWKGLAGYYSITVGDRMAEQAAWFYPNPTPPFAALQNLIAIYAGPMDACYVDGEAATPQPGEFYGGWVNSWVVGPFKSGPGSWSL